MLHYDFICHKVKMRYFVFFLTLMMNCCIFVSGHIPSLVKADMLDSEQTRLVAVNAIYFKGLWKSCFQPQNTKMRPFTGGDGNVYKVPMMSQLSVFNMGKY